MTPKEFYKAFAFPASCKLGKRVFKKLILENGDMSAADKRVLSSSVPKIMWQYTLKPATLPVQSYSDNEQEYDEIAVLEMEITDRRAAAKMSEVVHRTIPYPVLLLTVHATGVQLSAAPKRLSRAEKNRIIVTSVEFTPWFEGEEKTPVEQEFIDSLQIDKLPHTHFFALYTSWLQRIVALACGEMSGHFDLAPDRSIESRRVALNACRLLERDIVSMKAAMKAEAIFARKVELNTKLKDYERRLRRNIATL